MPTRLYAIVLDALDPRLVGAFWEAALGWTIGPPDDDDVPVRAPWAPDHLPWGLLIQKVPDPKEGKNRAHLDLASPSVEDQHATVNRLLGLGAQPLDIGQRDVPWVVLADPEGNEFCVLEPRDTYRDTGAVAAVVVATHHPNDLARFWTEASGWEIAYEIDDVVALRAPTPPGPLLEFVRSDEVEGSKNRLHLDVAPEPGGDQTAEVERLMRHGAEPADVGQGEVAWVVLRDPEGNEFCVLSPR